MAKRGRSGDKKKTSADQFCVALDAAMEGNNDPILALPRGKIGEWVSVLALLRPLVLYNKMDIVSELLHDIASIATESKCKYDFGELTEIVMSLIGRTDSLELAQLWKDISPEAMDKFFESTLYFTRIGAQKVVTMLMEEDQERAISSMTSKRAHPSDFFFYQNVPSAVRVWAVECGLVECTTELAIKMFSRIMTTQCGWDAFALFLYESYLMEVVGKRKDKQWCKLKEVLTEVSHFAVNRNDHVMIQWLQHRNMFISDDFGLDMHSSTFDVLAPYPDTKRQCIRAAVEYANPSS